MVTDAPVMTIPGDSLLDSISQELDPSGATQVDGLLGGSFLRNFLVTIDYPKGQLHLQRYTNETWKDEFQRVGVTISADPTTGAGYVVRSVYPGSDAESKGILANDEVLVIGETQLATLVPVTLETAVEADSLLEGAPGTTIAVTFGAAGSSSIANQKIDLLVDDLVPNPS
jgi:C-terminal processing protease CtpA/Prc